MIDASQGMLPHARRLVDVVHGHDEPATAAVLRVAAAVPLPAGLDPLHALIICLARMVLAPPKTPDIDPVAVARAAGGDRTIKLSHPERAEVVRQLRARGWSLRRIARHLGCNPSTVHADVARLASRTTPTYQEGGA